MQTVRFRQIAEKTSTVDEYFGQFVTEKTKAWARESLSVKAILGSQDSLFRDVNKYHWYWFTQGLGPIVKDHSLRTDFPYTQESLNHLALCSARAVKIEYNQKNNCQIPEKGLTNCHCAGYN